MAHVFVHVSAKQTMLAEVSVVVSCLYSSLWCVSLYVIINIIRTFKRPFEIDVENCLRKSMLQYI